MKTIMILIITMFFVISCDSDNDNASTVDSDTGDIFVECIYNESNPDPCDDPDNTEFFPREYGGLHWSCLSENIVKWDAAKVYCVEKGGHIPTISELRGLVRNCLSAKTDGTCGITDECFDIDTCDTEACHDGCSNNPNDHNMFCDAQNSNTGVLWSSTVYFSHPYEIGFRSGTIGLCQDKNVFQNPTYCVQNK